MDEGRPPLFDRPLIAFLTAFTASGLTMGLLPGLVDLTTAALLLALALPVVVAARWFQHRFVGHRGA